MSNFIFRKVYVSIILAFLGNFKYKKRQIRQSASKVILHKMQNLRLHNVSIHIKFNHARMNLVEIL